MRRSVAFGVILLALTLTAGRQQPTARTVVAHRGASWDAPEHTFAAYDQALAAGADYIEQDLQMTRDSVLVVLHDPTGARTLRGAPACTGRIIDATWPALADCDAGSWFNARWPERARSTYAAERVPTLRAVFERYGRRARYYIETKNPEEAPGMERQLVALIQEFKLSDRVLLQSFSAPSLLLLRDLAPKLPRIQLLSQRLSPDSLTRVAGWAQGVGPDRRLVDSAFVRTAHAAGLLIHPYTVDDTLEMDRLAALPVDGMFTDRPALLRARWRAPR